MTRCEICGRDFEGQGRLCDACRITADQSTTSFVPVGGRNDTAGAAIVHSPDDDIFLQVVKGPQVGERFFLEGDDIIIGRDPEVQLFLSDITVSREHAEILRKDADVFIRDMGSLNGTYLNGKIVEHAQLRSGDIIQIGTFQLMFCWGN